MERERLNGLIHLFGELQKQEMRAEKRDVMKAILFDLPRRSSLGWHALYEHEADFLRELSEHVSPEELGRRMRFPGSRPYALQPFIVVCSYLGARQQELLDSGPVAGRPLGRRARRGPRPRHGLVGAAAGRAALRRRAAPGRGGRRRRRSSTRP